MSSTTVLHPIEYDKDELCQTLNGADVVCFWKTIAPSQPSAADHSHPYFASSRTDSFCLSFRLFLSFNAYTLLTFKKLLYLSQNKRNYRCCCWHWRWRWRWRWYERDVMTPVTLCRCLSAFIWRQRLPKQVQWEASAIWNITMYFLAFEEWTEAGVWVFAWERTSWLPGLFLLLLLQVSNALGGSLCFASRR